MSPLFSIVIPTYNRPNDLFRLLNLILKQNYSDWEVIVVDDSIDSVQLQINEIGDDRFMYLHRAEKLGVSSARNFGADKANGKYLIFIDDDDLISPSCLEDYAILAKQNDFPDVLFCGMQTIDPLTKQKVDAYPGQELWRIIFPGSFAISTSVFRSLHGYDERILFGENTELFFRIRALDLRTAFTDKINFFYHPSVNGGSKNLANKIDSNQIVLAKHSAFFASNKKVARLFIQVIGVSCLKLGRYQEARHFLLKAFFLNPFKAKALVRLIVAHIPYLSKRVYLSNNAVK